MTPIHKILLYLGMGAAAVLVFSIFWLVLSNARLKAQLAEAHAHNTACRMANDQFSEKLAHQNRAVEQIKAESVRREEKAKSEIGKAQEAARAHQAAAEKLRNTKPGKDACKAAEALFNAYAEGNRP